MSKLLVTGGAGFIGANFIRYWLQKYPADSIVNLDALTYAGNLNNLKDLPSEASAKLGLPSTNYTFIKGDIRDSKIVQQAAANVDTIVHFAAESHVDRSIQAPGDFVTTNVNGTFELLEAARQKNIHFHHVSTDEVFGHLKLNSNEAFSESTPYNPRSPYSASKAGSDHLVRAYHTTYNLPITITNCSNNYGPYMHPEKFIPRMITNLLDGDNIKIYGDGKYVRDWLYVEDHCRAIDLILQSNKTGETYLVGGLQDDVSNLDVAQQILDLMGEPASKIEFVKDRPGHDRRYAVNWNKIKRDLNWQPAHNFTEHLTNTINWYKQNECWWRPLKAEAEALYQEK